MAMMCHITARIKRGREFAARHAECVFAGANNTKQMRSFCDDIATRAEKYGRDPRSIKIIWGAQPLVAHSTSEALTRQHEIRARIPIEASLALLGGHLNYNLNTLDIDLPVTDLDLKITGIQGVLEAAVKVDPKVTLRKIASTYLSGTDNGPLIGTASQVADHMVYLMEEGGGDGFQITPSYYGPDYFIDLNQMLIPELQRRGVFRTDYNGTTLRDYMNEDALARAAE